MSRPPRIPDGTRFFPDLLSSFSHPDFWAFSSWLDLVTKYRRAALGVVWILLPPFCYVFGIGYFYSLLFDVPSLPFMVHLGVGYLLPVCYLLWSLKWGRVSGANPWGATGLEWEIPSPPPTENFSVVPNVTWDPAVTVMKPRGSGR